MLNHKKHKPAFKPHDTKQPSRIDVAIEMMANYVVNFERKNPDVKPEFGYALCAGVFVAIRILSIVFKSSFDCFGVTLAGGALSAWAHRWKAVDPDAAAIVSSMERMRTMTLEEE